jgi:voltage-gated potassium channel
VGFGDIVPTTGAGRFVVGLEMFAAVTFIPFELSVLSQAMAAQGERERARRPAGGWRADVRCGRCGLLGHSEDASFCRACAQRLPACDTPRIDAQPATDLDSHGPR